MRRILVLASVICLIGCGQAEVSNPDTVSTIQAQLGKPWYEAANALGRDYELAVSLLNGDVALIYNRNGAEYLLILDEVYIVRSYQIGMKDFINIRELL